MAGPTSMYMFRDTSEMEKRQLFLRSYQFSRKKSVAEKIKGSFFRVKRVIWRKVRSARKLRRTVWLKLKNGLFICTKRRRTFFLRLNTNNGTLTDKYCFC